MTIKFKKSPNYTDDRQTRLVALSNVPVEPLNPSSVPGLVAWYKADSLALSNGATVTSWPDDSANNNDLDSYESAPIYNASDALLNGMPSVTYDGNDSNYRSNPTGLPVGSSACTTYVVGYWDGSSGGHDMFTWGSNAYTGARMGAGYYGGMIFENGGIGTSQRSVTANVPFIFSYPYVAGADVTAAVTYLTGVSASGAYPSTSGVPNISDPVAEITVGRPATAAVERWAGAVAEVLVFNTTHDAVTRGGIEKYLSNKYGISTLAVRSTGKMTTRTTALAPLVITYAIGAGGSGGSGANNGSSGGTTTLTFLGDTLTAGGGSGGEYNNNVDASGGTATGGDTNTSGGSGQGSSGDTGAGGGGGVGGANASEGNAGAGDTGAQSNDVSSLFATLSSLSIATTSPGSGGTGGANPNVDHGGNATGFGCGGGGAGWYGGDGGNGLTGGGGGGASGYSATQTGGTGGGGVIILSFTGGSPAAVALTSGTSYTVPAGTTQVKAWVVGGGGGGAGSNASDGASGGGGGAGAIAVKTWNV